MLNDFGKLDAQSELCSLALVSSPEVEFLTSPVMAKRVIHSNGLLGDSARGVRMLANFAAESMRHAKDSVTDTCKSHYEGKAFAFKLSANHMAFTLKLNLPYSATPRTPTHFVE